MRVLGKDLGFTYEKVQIFNRVNVEVRSGEVRTIVGPNGAGKSTLIKCLGQIHLPKEGVVYLGDREVREFADKELATMLGYVPQSERSTFAINVYESILLGRRPYINWRVSANDTRIVDEILTELKLAHLAERQIQTLSGGERQKVAIARAMAKEPKVLLLDEPTSNLDLNHQLEIMELLRGLARRKQVTVLMILHDLNLAYRYSDYVYLLGNKGVYATGSPMEVLTPENIRDVYGVVVEVLDTSTGPYIVPLSSVSR